MKSKNILKNNKTIIFISTIIILVFSYFAINNITYKNSYQYKLKEFKSCLELAELYNENNDCKRTNGGLYNCLTKDEEKYNDMKNKCIKKYQ